MSRKTIAELRFIGVVEEIGEEEATIRVFPEYCTGLKGIAEYSHIIVLYWMHLRDTREERATVLVYPRRHAISTRTGVFACRSPSRPNPIGLCVVELVRIRKCVLSVKGLDALEDSPIIDIKPYIPGSDMIPNAKAPEWVEQGPST